jgi:hypothetical protein
MKDLLKNVVQLLDDFLLERRHEPRPDFTGRRAHDSYSFTRDRSSRTAARQSLERGASWPKTERLVARRGIFRTMPSRKRTNTYDESLVPREMDRT